MALVVWIMKPGETAGGNDWEIFMNWLDINFRQHERTHMLLVQAPVEMLSQQVRHVVRTKNFVQREVLCCQAVLDPEIRDRKMPDAAKAAPSAYADSRGRIRVNTKRDCQAQILA